MPVVPYSKVPTVQTNALPGVTQNINTSADMFIGIAGRYAGDVGKSLQTVGDAMLKKQKKEQEQKDAGAVFDADSKITEESIKFMADAKDKRQGLSAQGLTDDTNKFFNDQKSTLLAGAQNSEQRRLIEQAIERRRVSALASASEYQSSQIEKGHDAAWNANIDSLRNQVIGSDDPEINKRTTAEINAKIDYMAAHKGLGSDWADQEKQKNLNVVDKSKMDVWRTNKQPEKVLDYIATHGERMDAQIKADYQAEASKMHTDKVLTSYADASISNGTSYGDAVAAAKKKNPDVDEATIEKAIGARYAESEQIKRQNSSKMVGDINKQAFNDGGMFKITDDQLARLAQVDAEAANRIKASRDKEIKIRAEGGEFADGSDPDKLAEVTKLLVNGDLTSKADLVQYRPYLSKEDWGSLVKGMTDQRKVSDTDLLEAYKMYMPKNDRVPAKWKIDRWNDFAAFKKNAVNAVAATGNAQHVNLDAARWFMKGKVEGSGLLWDDRITQGEAIVQGKTANFVPTETIPVNPLTEPGLNAEARVKARQSRTITKTGTINGKKVVQYSDGSVEYAQ